MATTRCCQGLDVLLGLSEGAAEAIGLEPGTKYLVLHVDNPEGLVKKEKGSGIAWAATTFAPDFVVKKIYDEVGKQLQQQFKEKGSTVTVEVVETPPQGKKLTSDLFTGMFVGGGLTAAVFLLVKYFKARKVR